MSIIKPKHQKRVLKGTFVISLLALLLLAGSAPRALFAASEWQAEYWNNTSLSGDPVLERRESALDHDWGNGSPSRRVDSNHFSARWERDIHVSAGVYRFTATMDDGMRVWVDDSRIIDSWWDSQVHSVSADIYLTSGEHEVKVKYYEAGGQAVAKLHWGLVSNTPSAIYNWRGEYYNNMGLSGSPALVRDDREIDFDWGGGAPEWNVVRADQFSVRWTRDLSLSPGRYRFDVTADDGVRLWVNGQLLIDQWHDSGPASYQGTVDVVGSRVPVRMEYYENQGGAMARLSWQRVGDAGIYQWRGEYFNNRWLSGTPTLVRQDGHIDFNWGNGSPASGLPNDGFSVRWTRELNFPAGTYRFTTTSDDGVRLWVNGHLLIDRWQDQAAATHHNTIYLAGNAPVKMEYYEGSGRAEARLTWSRVSEAPAPPPASPARGTVVVDDSSSGFVRGGAVTSWRTASDGYEGQLTWTYNNDRVRDNYNWGRWYPSLAAGRYEVFVYVPAAHSSTESARYWVSHQGGHTERTVDQADNGGRWVSLGTYWFWGDGRDYVTLSDVTFESYLSREIAFDALLWEPR